MPNPLHDMAGRVVARFARLAATAQSVNAKERLHFSCALFDPEGNLVANAPHIPVHLGSLLSHARR